MYNILDYLTWRGDLSFKQDSYNYLDGAVFSQLSYLDISNIIKNGSMNIGNAYTEYLKDKDIKKTKLGLILPNILFDLGKRIVDIERFKNLTISDFVSSLDIEKKEQFSAMTIHLDRNNMVIVYEGTDDTLVGWEEDFQMLVKFPIPAQVSALNYFNNIKEKYHSKKIHICGHSKGGNLALYTGVFCDDNDKERIQSVYSYDGPAFSKSVLDNNKYDLIKDKIISFLPQKSVIGYFFDPIGEIFITHSNGKGLYQHNVFTWEVTNKSFVRIDSFSKESINIKKELNTLLDSIDDDERMRLSQAISNFIAETKSLTLLELNAKKLKVLQGYRYFKKEERAIFFKILRILILNKAFS